MISNDGDTYIFEYKYVKFITKIKNVIKIIRIMKKNFHKVTTLDYTCVYMCFNRENTGVSNCYIDESGKFTNDNFDIRWLYKDIEIGDIIMDLSNDTEKKLKQFVAPFF